MTAGAVWDRILHELSEHLLSIRRSTAPGTGLPFARARDDLAGFSVRDTHIASRESAIRSITSEFDSADEPISRHWAQIFAVEQSKQLWAPSAYDIVVLCNSLTNTAMTEKFAGEVNGLGHSLTPGGVLVAIGGTGSQYPDVWSRLDEILRIKGRSWITFPGRYALTTTRSGGG